MTLLKFRKKPLNATSHSLALLALIGLTLPAVAGSDDTEGTTRTTYGEMKWNEFPGGRAIADVVGHFKTGPHLKFVRFDAGVKTPAHTHSYGYTGIVVTGRARHYEPGNPSTQTILEPGSTWSINAGVPHISECLEGAECLFATQSDGPFDSAPAN